MTPKPWVCVCGHNRSWHYVGNPFFPDRESCLLCAVCGETHGRGGWRGHEFKTCNCEGETT